MRTVILLALFGCVTIVLSAPSTPNPFFEQLFDPLDETFADSAAPDQFECIVNYLGEVSKANNLGELWSRSEPQLKYHIENWKLCPNSSKKVLVYLCNLKEFFQTTKVLIDYMKLLSIENPKALLQFARGLPLQCGSVANELSFLLSDNDEEINYKFDKLKALIERFRCSGKEIAAVFQGTKYQKIFDNHIADMEETKAQLKVCKAKDNKIEAIKCSVVALKFGTKSLIGFLKQLAVLYYEIKDDKETIGRVQKGVKKCRDKWQEGVNKN